MRCLKTAKTVTSGKIYCLLGEYSKMEQRRYCMKRLGMFVCLNLLIVGSLVAQSDLQPIATVRIQKNEPITLRQLKTRVEAYQKEMGRVMTLDERKKVLDTIINERLVVQAAEKEGLRVPDSEVNQNFIQMISQQVGRNVTEAEFAQLIKQQTGLSLDDYMRAQNGMSLADYKNFLRSQIIAQRYVMSKNQAQLQNMAGPSDSDIRSYYELNKQSFVQPDMVKIFLVVAAKNDNPSAAEQKVRDLHKQLQDNPKVVGELRIRSQEAGSGYQAGEMFVNKNNAASRQLGISMEALLKIFNMSIHEVSDVTETENDFQCFIVQDKFSAKILDLSDVVKPGTNVTLYEYIKNNMHAQATNQAINAALNQLISDLRKPENFQILRSGADLDNALSW